MPDSPILEAYLQGVVATVARWGPAVTFAAMWLECVPVLGLAVPGLTVLVAAGFVASTQGVSSGSALFAAALAGVLVADCLGFTAGRASHRLAPIRRLVERNAKLCGEMERQPLLLLLFYQFPPYSRMFAPLLLGALELPARRWIALVSTGTLLFVTVFFGFGYAAGRLGQALIGAYSIAGTVTTIFLVGLFLWIGGVGWRLYKTRTPREATG